MRRILCLWYWFLWTATIACYSHHDVSCWPVVLISRFSQLQIPAQVQCSVCPNAMHILKVHCLAGGGCDCSSSCTGVVTVMSAKAGILCTIACLKWRLPSQAAQARQRQAAGRQANTSRHIHGWTRARPAKTCHEWTQA